MILGGELLSAFGSGATVSYLIVYLYKVCGVAVAAASVLLIVRALLAIAGAAAGGPLTDRIGSKYAAAITLAGAGIASLALASARQPAFGLAAASIVTALQLMCMPALDTMLAITVPQTRRQTAFAWRQTAINFGAASGAATAALVLSREPATEGLPLIYILDGASYILYAATILTFIRVGGRQNSLPQKPEDLDGSRSSSSYRRVFEDRPMRWLLAIVAIVVSVGFTQFEIGLPALVVNGGINPAALGWMYAVNAIAVLSLQLPIQRLVIGRSRGVVLGSAMAIMTVSWMLVVVSLGHGTALLVTVGAVFGIGETLYTPVVQAIVNDLALPHIRGRYNGAQAVTHTTAWLLGAAVSTAFLASGPSGTRLLFMACMATLLIGLPAAFRLQRALPAGLARVPDPASDSADRMASRLPERTEPDPSGDRNCPTPGSIIG
ncbi:MFS transporter [Streptomyces sp. NPDC048419]|uniref:MFS transporter n=1 Tax=Streptomyces sp. NPDC048419 TaxID=3365547 RepID=UPI00371096AE